MTLSGPDCMRFTPRYWYTDAKRRFDIQLAGAEQIQLKRRRDSQTCLAVPAGFFMPVNKSRGGRGYANLNFSLQGVLINAAKEEKY